MAHTRSSSELDRPPGRNGSLRRRVPPGRLPECMDAPDCDRAQLAGALDALSTANRFFGGQRALRIRIEQIVQNGGDGPLRVLDVGAGGGDVSLRLARSLRGRGCETRFVLADLHAGVLDLCRDRVGTRGGEAAGGAAYVRLDGAALPFPDDAFDIAFSSATLHHLDDRDAVRLLRELDRVSRLGWVVTDLRRSRTALLSVRALAATLWRSHPFPRTDGPISVRRSFTVSEVRRLLADAGLEAAVVRSRPVRWIAWRHRAAGARA